MVMAFIETVQANVTEIREHEEKFHKEMSDAALIFSDKFSKGEIENALDYPDDVHAVCMLCLTPMSLMHCSCCETKRRSQTRSAAGTMSRWSSLTRRYWCGSALRWFHGIVGRRDHCGRQA
jgi:hypothetical protein